MQHSSYHSHPLSPHHCSTSAHSWTGPTRAGCVWRSLAADAASLHVQPCRSARPRDSPNRPYRPLFLCRRMRGMTSMRAAWCGRACVCSGLVNEASSSSCCHYSGVGSAGSRRDRAGRVRKVYKRRRESGLRQPSFHTHHAIKRLQSKHQFNFPNNLSFSSFIFQLQAKWVAADSAPTPTVLARPEAATARVSLVCLDTMFLSIKAHRCADHQKSSI